MDATVVLVQTYQKTIQQWMGLTQFVKFMIIVGPGLKKWIFVMANRTPQLKVMIGAMTFRAGRYRINHKAFILCLTLILFFSVPDLCTTINFGYTFQFCCGSNEQNVAMKCCIGHKCNHIEQTCDTTLCECDRNFTLAMHDELLKSGCPNTVVGCSSANSKMPKHSMMMMMSLQYIITASLALVILFNV